MARGAPIKFTDNIFCNWGPAGRFLAVMMPIPGELRWGYDLTNGQCRIVVHGIQHQQGATSALSFEFGANVGIGIGPIGFTFGAGMGASIRTGWTIEVDPEVKYLKCPGDKGCQKVVKVDLFRNYEYEALVKTALGFVTQASGKVTKDTSKMGTIHLKTPCDGNCCPGAGVAFAQAAQVKDALPAKPKERLPADGERPWKPFDRSPEVQKTELKME
ncbi:hypothetical protein EU803_00895 [Loktanella sp. IMCC34160]|uniref:hypothetical protein n=1 Tax=Loktanella sp. IMCC34160 TaxID=2510646 RepID=UPI00101BE878|nr:hypothetical protein [Loktanella sp. IMCC34160]RYG92695.1 hypothetical protein EU803_00895 [Loktanella sp. IMCC34160]